MEVKIVLAWYIIFIIFGIIGLPITNLIFKGWADRGYGFAKFVGLFVVGMFTWFLASIKIVPYTDAIAWVFVLIALGISVYFIQKQKIKLNKYMIIQELFFLVNIIIWAYIRGSNSRVEGTEKFMNIAFMNSIARTEYFPPADPWMYGETINYYYLGHYLFVFAGKLGGIAVSYIYNLALITIISQTFISLFSIFAQFFKKSGVVIASIFGFLGATWITYGGNMHYIGSIIISWFKSGDFTYYFPNSTRIIPFTINEFPAYSIVLGDVHGHYLGLPFFIIAVAAMLASFRVAINKKTKLKLNAALSLFVITLYGINSWDFITVSFLFFTLHAYQAYKLESDWKEKVKFFLLAEAALMLPGILLMVPYLANFNAPLIGEGKFIIDKFLGFTPVFILQNSDKLEINKFAEIIPWLAMWGMFLFITVSFYISKALGVLKDSEIYKPTILVFASLALIFGVEIFFFKDIFHTSNPPYFRTNTVFKFYYHAWIIWGIASTWLAYLLFDASKKKYRFYVMPLLATIFLFFLGSIIYIRKAVTDFYPEISKKEITLDGNFYIKNELDKVGDYEAIRWINENIEGQPVFAEAVGEAYTYYSRVSANTGVITVMGWPTHEWQWRGDATEAFKRKDDMYIFYTTTSEADYLRLINLYDIEYVFVGGKEREAYTVLNEQNIMNYGDLVYNDSVNNTRIYKVRSIKIDTTQQSSLEGNTAL